MDRVVRQWGLAPNGWSNRAFTKFHSNRRMRLPCQPRLMLGCNWTLIMWRQSKPISEAMISGNAHQMDRVWLRFYCWTSCRVLINLVITQFHLNACIMRSKLGVSRIATGRSILLIRLFVMFRLMIFWVLTMLRLFGRRSIRKRRLKICPKPACHAIKVRFIFQWLIKIAMPVAWSIQCFIILVPDMLRQNQALFCKIADRDLS